MEPVGHEAEAAQTFESMANEIASLAPGTLRDVARSFAHFLALSNAAEQEHRVRRLEAHRGDGAPLYPGKTDSCAGTLDYLLDEEHVDMTKNVAALAAQQLEIVLTAHPDGSESEDDPLEAPARRRVTCKKAGHARL